MQRLLRGKLKVIENERQLQITQEAAAKFARALANFDERPEAHPGVHPLLIAAMKAGLAGQLKTLQAEIEAYKTKATDKPIQIGRSHYVQTTGKAKR